MTTDDQMAMNIESEISQHGRCRVRMRAEVFHWRGYGTIDADFKRQPDPDGCHWTAVAWDNGRHSAERLRDLTIMMQAYPMPPPAKGRMH